MNLKLGTWWTAQEFFLPFSNMTLEKECEATYCSIMQLEDDETDEKSNNRIKNCGCDIT